jgi:hypothetical protein
MVRVDHEVSVAGSFGWMSDTGDIFKDFVSALTVSNADRLQSLITHSLSAMPFNAT